ncbi:hypothetical protein [Ruminococcus sp. NK3A76]|uniref:hypothetical protein n=1 Tax=Ruminococcus sp. NK3A76 TaxID=877411 RepID=UPI00048C0B47|nr:hypothetical protein [Ruminococcus sp. NK3A76]
MMTATGGYFNGDHIVMDEQITLKNGQRVIITVLDPFQSDVRADKGDIKSFMGRGKKLFDDTTAIDKYVMELRDNDRI